MKTRMELRNKETGEIRKARIADGHLQLWSISLDDWIDFDDLEYLAKWWERYEEPKVSALDTMILTLTNFIENEPDEDMVDLEDCKQMLEKLKAWKRLKDKGFRFDGYDVAHKSNGNLAGQIFYDAGNYSIEDVEKEMDLLFGGEE